MANNSRSTKNIEDIVRSINYITDKNLKLPKWLQREMENYAQEEMFFGFEERFTPANLQDFFQLAQNSNVKIKAQYVDLSTQNTPTNYNSVESLLMAEPQDQNKFLAVTNAQVGKIADPVIKARTYCNMAAIYHSRGDADSQAKAFECYQNAIFSLPARNANEAKDIVQSMKSLDQVELQDARGSKMDQRQYFETVDNYFNRQNLFGATSVKETVQNINEGKFQDSYLSGDLLSRGRSVPSTTPSQTVGSALGTAQSRKL